MLTADTGAHQPEFSAQEIDQVRAGLAVDGHAEQDETIHDYFTKVLTTRSSRTPAK